LLRHFGVDEFGVLDLAHELVGRRVIAHGRDAIAGPVGVRNRATLEEQLAFATKVAPKLTIQGGTTEILRGIIAPGLGLR